MVKRLFVASFLLTASISIPQTGKGQIVTTQNSYVAASVTTDGFGLMSLYAPSQQKSLLSFIQKSYLTVEVNGQYYTNNPNLPSPYQAAPSPQRPAGLLQNGQTTKIADTIETVWSISPTIDIIQDVYPAGFIRSGLIVFGFKVINRGTSPVTAGAQYLLDLMMYQKGEVNSNDDPNIVSFLGYDNAWNSYPNARINARPPFYLSFENPLGDPNFPGMLGVGFLTDLFTPKPLGLIEPDSFTYVDWPVVVQSYTAGWPHLYAGMPTYDAAALYQWGTVSIPAGATQLVGRSCYGTIDYRLCHGVANGITLYPEQATSGKFPVGTIILNGSSTTSISTSSATLTLPSSMQIASSSATQNVSPAIIPPLGIGVVQWDVTTNSTAVTDTSSINVNVSLSNASVTESTDHQLLSIAPNPMESSSTLRITDGASADIQIFDVLGREIDHFKMTGSYVWSTDQLLASTYIIRATIGDQVISKRVVKE